MEPRPTIKLKTWARSWQEAFIERRIGDWFQLAIYLEGEGAPIPLGNFEGELLPHDVDGWYVITNSIQREVGEDEHSFSFRPEMVSAVAEILPMQMTIHL
jgi:hypothetical protein